MKVHSGYAVVVVDKVVNAEASKRNFFQMIFLYSPPPPAPVYICNSFYGRSLLNIIKFKSVNDVVTINGLTPFAPRSNRIAIP